MSVPSAKEILNNHFDCVDRNTFSEYDLIHFAKHVAKLHLDEQRKQICHKMDTDLENSEDVQKIVQETYPNENVI